ncbi:hypothetical protein EYF80_056030 [Liparis tanakae]|uniref:Uncharacterized protein n=1 Tax=Liparis tanakae TaxID=230148 RepID=A0A4Z2EXW8_9TELE|nr:hypothetical protein EYF80_056030 [Liparis tanakae]
MNVHRHQTSVFTSSAPAGSRRSETNEDTEQQPVTSQQVREPITSSPLLNTRAITIDGSMALQAAAGQTSSMRHNAVCEAESRDECIGETERH